MRTLLLASAILGGAWLFSGAPAQAAPTVPLHGIEHTSGATPVDYYWHHHHWHHRRWSHNHWHYWD